MDKVAWSRITGQMNQIKDKASDAAEDQALKDACAGFEAVFMEKMIGEMRKTLPGNALFQDSNAQDIYQSMHDQELADRLSQGHGGMGLKEFLYRELKKSN
ncbi:MAG: rod-binding protein [Desulfobacterales bacterium]|nr:rod-binding protein [Desulfobacterales bacterium]